MCNFNASVVVGAVLALAWSAASTADTPWQHLGHALSPAAIASWDIDVRPDGAGLPPGHGSVAEGQVIYDAQCASCHGTFGESTDFMALAGGVGSLATPTPQRTVGSKLNYATTLWDYINRAMPFNNAKSLSANEVYAVTAYVLNLNEVVAADAVLNENSLPAVAMPNREGFTLAHGFMHTGDHGDVQNTACMRDCPVAVAVQSALPEHFTAQMYGDIRTHFRQLAAPSAAATAANNNAARDLDHTPTKLARQAGCLVCHGIDATVIGPAFRAVAQRYPDQSGAQATLVAKVRHGGAGVWGSTAMPPQTGITDDQLARLVSWILAGAKDD